MYKTQYNMWKEKKEGGVVCLVCVLVNDYVRFVLTNLRKKKTQVIEVKKYLGVIFKDIIHGSSLVLGVIFRNSFGITCNMLLLR